jgi:leader peptidase (prepilin peptidase)/N-methyltransferase
VDIESWIVPLRVCWFVSVVGLAAAAADPPQAAALLAPVSAHVGATSVGAMVGLIVAIVLLRRGIIQPSFLDADERKSPQGEKPKPPPAAKKKGKKTSKRKKGKKKPVSRRAAENAKKPRPAAVALTRAHGVNPRKEILREVLFLAPAVAGAVVAYLLVTRVARIERFWGDLHASRHVAGFAAALFGYLIGGLWIWGMRILGTLAFGKEAMGMGDVHILAAVGAVTGWFLPSVAFFLAPVFGLLWALYLLASRNQRELPYGPWLAAASLVMLLFYDPIAGFLSPYTEGLLKLTVR